METKVLLLNKLTKAGEVTLCDNKAKNAGIAIVMASIFNAVSAQKNKHEWSGYFATMPKTILKIITPLLLLLVSACYNVNKNNVLLPDNFLAEEKMIDVLTDIQVLEGTLAYDRTKRIDISDLKGRYYNQVFLKYNITPTDFKQNMDYYNSSPDKIEKILEKVLENLNQMQGTLEKKITDKKIADSLRTIFVQDSLIIADSIKLVFKADSLRLADSLSVDN